MSGGSFDYIYYQLERASNLTSDKELSDLLLDLSEVLHDEEWYESADIGKEEYLKTLTKFKNKWFKGKREERLKSYIDKELANIKNDLYAMIGVE